MKKSKIPTFIGMAVLIFGLAAAVLLVNSKQIFRLGASADETPKDVRISNISDQTFTVTWTTDKETVGFILWGENQNSLENTEVDSFGVAGFTHYAVIQSLSPQTDYYFKINSNGTEYDNNGIPWQTKTGITLADPAESNFISGSVLTATGEAAKNALVYITVGGAGLLSAEVSSTGNWLINLSLLRTQNLNQYFLVNGQTTLLEISVNAGVNGITSAQIYPQSAKPIPQMILGQVFDFKTLPPSRDSNLPQADITLPEQSTPSSGFDVEDNATPSAKVVTLTSIDEGEVISTVDPEFFGSGPTGTTITITVESDPQTDTVTVTGGTWNWSPPENLEPGTHKITVSWRDAAGILRTITRNFVVQASELPAFESTPSGTPKTTTTPKPTTTAPPTVKPTSTSTISATLKPTASISAAPQQPVSGNLTPTLILSIMGIGSIAFGLFLWRKAET